VVLLQRLAGTPLLVTGTGAAALEPRVTALLHELTEEDAHASVCTVVPGRDAAAVLQEAARLVRTAPAPAPAPEAEAGRPLLSGPCAH
jgi:hypothetical protein